MRVLGLSAQAGPSAAAYVRDGVPIAASTEAHFSRKLGDTEFPSRAMRFCLEQGGVNASELDWVVLHHKPLRRFERTIHSHLHNFPFALSPFRKSMSQWLGDWLWIRGRIADELDLAPDRIVFTEHHIALAANAFFTSPYSSAALLVADGPGEWATTSFGRAESAAIELLGELRHPHALTFLCDGVARYLGLEGGRAGRAQLADLSAWGKPRHAHELGSLVPTGESGAYSLAEEVQTGSPSPEEGVARVLIERLGPARELAEPLAFRGERTLHADVAASAQRVLEDRLLALAQSLHAKTQSDRLCVAGEIALNSLAMSRLRLDGPFASLYVPATPGDEGAALGAALQLSALTGDLEPGRRCFDPYLGEAVLESADARSHVPSACIVGVLAERIAERQIVGWMRGRAALGERGLGRRDLYCRCDDPLVHSRLREQVKPREAFRGFQLALPLDRVRDFFDCGGGENALVCPAGTLNGLAMPLRPEMRARLAHLADPAGRLSPLLVDRTQDGPLVALLEATGERTGLSALVVSGLHLPGEPPARSEAEAVTIAERTALDALAVDDRLYCFRAM